MRPGAFPMPARRREQRHAPHAVHVDRVQGLPAAHQVAPALRQEPILASPAELRGAIAGAVSRRPRGRSQS